MRPRGMLHQGDKGSGGGAFDREQRINALVTVQKVFFFISALALARHQPTADLPREWYAGDAQVEFRGDLEGDRLCLLPEGQSRRDLTQITDLELVLFHNSSS
jgi:hypothetical protein